MDKQAVGGGFIRRIQLVKERIRDPNTYPFNLPAIRHLTSLELHAGVTFLVGDNGSGKSTLLEAIAIAGSINPEGGSRNIQFAARPSESSLYEAIRLVRGPKRERDGFFLRAETLFNVATHLDQIESESPGILASSYGGRSLHEQSHGESFLALLVNRLGGSGLYLMDEPEAALSPSRQLAFLVVLNELIRRRSQLIIATHSPILLALPTSTIYEFGTAGIRQVPYNHTEAYTVYSEFLAAPDAFIQHLLHSEGVDSKG